MSGFTDESNKTIRASATTFLIFSAMAAIMASGGIIAVAKGQWQGLVAALVGVSVTIVPISRYRISWTKHLIEYRGLLHTSRAEFRQVTGFDFNSSSSGRPYGPISVLRIFVGEESEPAISANIKPFSRADIALLVARLEAATQSAEAPRPDQ